MPPSTIPFFKMSGSGNDFIVIDNRVDRFPGLDLPAWVRKTCKRAMSVGADGVILIEGDPELDFSWRFFNADGSVAEMCGNGARCAARFAVENGIAGRSMRFRTIAGIIAARVDGRRVILDMTAPTDLSTDFALEIPGGIVMASSINTGVPHLVVAVADIEAVDLPGLGRTLRYHPDFAPAGTNVNFIQPMGGGVIAFRTYERGVEAETLACGTGAVASALVAAAGPSPATSPAAMRTRSGETLTIHFRKAEGGFTDVKLEGDARIVYLGEADAEAWTYGG